MAATASNTELPGRRYVITMTSLGPGRTDIVRPANAMADPICCKYPAHPPADGPSNAKGSARHCFVLTILFERRSSYRGPGFEVCSGRILSFPLERCSSWHNPKKWHNTVSLILIWLLQTQHSTAQHNTAQHHFLHHEMQRVRAITEVS
jgi:hypothetical protein